MKTLFSARSPIWQLVFMIHTFALAILGSQILDQPVDTTDQSQRLMYFAGIFASFFIWSVAAAVVIHRYNKTSRKKISLFQLSPPELLSDDERATQFTARAARRVYEYHNYAWPIALIVMIVMRSIPMILLIVCMVLVGHYVVYWYHMRTLLSDE